MNTSTSSSWTRQRLLFLLAGIIVVIVGILLIAFYR